MIVIFFPLNHKIFSFNIFWKFLEYLCIKFLNKYFVYDQNCTIIYFYPRYFLINLSFRLRFQVIYSYFITIVFKFIYIDNIIYLYYYIWYNDLIYFNDSIFNNDSITYFNDFINSNFKCNNCHKKYWNEI